MARKGSSVEPRNSELGCPILRALEWMVAAAGEQSRSFFSPREDGWMFLPFQEFLFQFFLMSDS